MSHSTVTVIIDQRVSVLDLEEAVAEALAPFDETTEVPRYRKLTRQEAIDEERLTYAKMKGNTYDQWQLDKEGYEADCRNPAHLEYLKNEFLEKFNSIMKDDDAAWKEATRWEEPVHVQDDGIYSTYNPKSKWDWWVIGGRWSGRVFNAVPVGTEQDFFTKEDFTVYGKGQDVLRRLDLSEGPKSTFAVLTKDGEWKERGNMGWWGMVADEKEQDDWDKEYKEILNSIPAEDWIVLVDVHI